MKRSILALTCIVAFCEASQLKSHLQGSAKNLAQAWKSKAQSQAAGWVPNPTGQTCLYGINRYKAGGLSQVSATASNPFVDTNFDLLSEGLQYATKYEGSVASNFVNSKKVERFLVGKSSNSLWGKQSEDGLWQGVKQGLLGDCYFLQSVSGFSEHTYNGVNRVRNPIDNTKTNVAQGKVVGNFYVRGIKTEIVVDDTLFDYPTYTNFPAFAKVAADGATFTPIMEKMFAKAMGNYEVLEGGTHGEAQAFLSGAPTDSFYYSSSPYTGEQAWTALTAAASQKYIIEASTASNGGGDSHSNQWGIPFGHAYTILGTCTLTDTSGNVLDKVMKLRNPWGKDSFNNAGGTYIGKWNDADPAWANVSPSVISSCGYSNNVNDGIFFVSSSEFSQAAVQMFPGYQISYYRDNWVHSVKEVLADTGSVTHFTFTLTQPTSAYIGVHYYPARMYPATCRTADPTTGRTYTRGSFSIFGPLNAAQLNKGGQTAYDFQDFNFAYDEAWPAGTYDVYVKTEWLTSDATDFTFRLYSASPIAITQVPITSVDDALVQTASSGLKTL